MSKGVKSYFEQHTHHYINKPSYLYSSIAKEIRKNIDNDRKINFLDVGCGDGGFIKAMLEQGIEANYIATDLSLNMAFFASKDLKNRSVHVFVSDVFRLSLREDLKFDIIHMDSVLHHLIGSTRAQSMRLAERLLEMLVQRLNNNGILIVEEITYNSYLFPEVTSGLIFYALKLMNRLNMNLSFIKDFRPGLEVNFFSEKHIIKKLRPYGSVHLINKESWELPRIYKIFLLKERGHNTYAVNIKHA